MQIGYKSHASKSHFSNTDYVIVVDVLHSTYESVDLRRILAIVADGKGDFTASVVIAETIKDTLLPELIQLYSIVNFVDWDMKRGFIKANEKYSEHIVEHIIPPVWGDPAASAALICEGQLYVGHAGDTRVYVIGSNGISQVTKDNVVPFNGRKKWEPDVYTKTLNEGDYILLCSDGLVEVVGDFEIQHLVCKLKYPQIICGELVKLANMRGGQDDISVVVIGPYHSMAVEEKVVVHKRVKESGRAYGIRLNVALLGDEEKDEKVILQHSREDPERTKELRLE
jgi:serine/threonine protein phosphatase PrpC